MFDQLLHMAAGVDGSEGAAGAGTGIRKPQFALLAAYLVHFAPLPIQKHVLRAIDDRFLTAGTTIRICIEIFLCVC